MDYADHNIRFAADAAPEPRHTLSKITIVAMSAVAVVLGLIGVDVALISGTQPPAPRPVVQVVKTTATTKTQVQPVVYLTVSPDLKPGPDGKLHDAFSVTSFDVHAGQPVKLVINNTDDTVHSINAPGAGVNIIVHPGVHTYTLLVHKTGSFAWYCMMPCDPYSMAHVGYMRGSITSI